MSYFHISDNDDDLRYECDEIENEYDYDVDFDYTYEYTYTYEYKYRWVLSILFCTDEKKTLVKEKPSVKERKKSQFNYDGKDDIPFSQFAKPDMQYKYNYSSPKYKPGRCRFGIYPEKSKAAASEK